MAQARGDGLGVQRHPSLLGVSKARIMLLVSFVWFDGDFLGMSNHRSEHTAVVSEASVFCDRLRSGVVAFPVPRLR